MRLDRVMRIDSTRAAALAGVLALVTVGAACNLDKKEIPPLSGPAELGQSVQLTASPDVITADGVSTSSVQVLMRGPNGQPSSGVGVFFALADGSGTFGDIGTLSSSTATTGSNGIAQVIYKSPPRTDATANRTIFIEARPIAGDANGQLYRRVRLELRSAEPRLFPPNALNCSRLPPVAGQDGCPRAAFVVEGPFGRQFLFQSTSSDSADTSGRVGEIVRYFWDFGDGSQGEDKPDVSHGYALSGSYTVTHIVTDDNGAQATAVAVVTVP